ncbi:hypothetical protein SDC9_99254 [bioreactor metagenome]|uniref:Uncharacterized protein n=1 Tax=bioreactor metagenome TaxID=1076179 RepID=A0A645AH26_9ZZZZ
MNGVPVARQSRSLACPAGQVESHTLIEVFLCVAVRDYIDNINFLFYDVVYQFKE